MSTAWFYEKVTTTNAFVEVDFGFLAGHFILVVPSNASEDVQFSLDGTTLEGELEAGEAPTFDGRTIEKIYVKSASGGEEVRIWAWRGE